ncbi:MAG: phage baseplate protein, partial [Candidatus Actinomarina sp.]
TAVQTAVNTKADLAGSASQAFSATTASTGTNTTQVATTAFVQNTVTAATINALAYPVGSIYTSVVATNPATLLGVGTWAAFGAGKVMVGIDSGDTDFDTVEETGGAKTHTLTTSEIPAHNHSASGGGSSTDSGNANYPNGGVALYNSTSNTWNNITIGNTGGGGAHNNLQPYIVVYMWKRTA